LCYRGSQRYPICASWFDLILRDVIAFALKAFLLDVNPLPVTGDSKSCPFSLRDFWANKYGVVLPSTFHQARVSFSESGGFAMVPLVLCMQSIKYGCRNVSVN